MYGKPINLSVFIMGVLCAGSGGGQGEHGEVHLLPGAPCGGGRGRARTSRPQHDQGGCIP